MGFIDFREAFTKVARTHGMGEAVNSSIVCHQARELMQELMPMGGFEVKSFNKGTLLIAFESSSALTHFSHLKKGFSERLRGLLITSFHGESAVPEIELKLVIR